MTKYVFPQRERYIQDNRTFVTLRCHSRTTIITPDSSNLSHCLFQLLPSNKRHTYSLSLPLSLSLALFVCVSDGQTKSSPQSAAMEILVTILLLLIPVNSAAVKKNLTSTEGGNVTFPDPLQQTGFLLFGTQVIAMVVNGGLNIPQNVFRDRILWNSSTGALTLTGLQRTDSGDYSIQSVVDDVSSRFLYELKVYETVPVPSVDRVSNDSCVLLCSVGAAEETTLSWYKDVELVKSSSSAASLDLSLQRDDFSAEYKCVAANPVEKKPVSVHVHTLCPEVSEDNTGR
ncbi:CD48 antigen isoform X2 [Cynoglossus semilaevis]|nr:CD48 antigen isoform X2 [Cynoglossus semilaevis]